MSWCLWWRLYSLDDDAGGDLNNDFDEDDDNDVDNYMMLA